MNTAIDECRYDVVVTFKNGCRVNGICTWNPLVSTPTKPHGIFDEPFLMLETCVVKTVERAYETGYIAMIRTEDISMIQVKKVAE